MNKIDLRITWYLKGWGQVYTIHITLIHQVICQRFVN